MRRKHCILNVEKIKDKHFRQMGSISPFEAGIPLVDIDDCSIEEIYYFRWHTYCQQIKHTPKGYVVTEFLPDVHWAGIYNTINCPAGHHFYEGRWLHNREYLSDYARFWFEPEAEPRKYSFWAADAIVGTADAWGDYSVAEELFDKLKANYEEWEKTHKRENGLFYQIDNYDGMEFSISGSGLRPTINSYMYADAVALSRLAKRLGKTEYENIYREKAEALRTLINQMLWDEKSQFYKTLSENKGYDFADVREEAGYIPWCFNIPEERMNAAWKFLNDENYFWAPFGPTTAERNHPDFLKRHEHECLWNGYSWPFATTQTLTALSKLIKNYKQDTIKKTDFYKLLRQYADCHYLNENGQKVPFIDESIDPFTGEWITRRWLYDRDDANKDRGKDYNHSAFCDLVISGLAGISFEDGIINVEPLFDGDDLKFFCADGIKYQDKYITVLWDTDGCRYGKGRGLKIYIDGEEVASSSSLTKLAFGV